MVGSREPLPTIKDLNVTIIELEPARDEKLAKDIIEIATGVSSNAAAAGGKITAGAIIYAGHETPDQKMANNVFWIGSLAFSIFDFLLIPLGYLYKLYKKEPVPFNFDNNTKWALAGVTLLLSIISASVAAAARPISFISAGLAIVVGILSLCKYFYDYRKTGFEFQAATERVGMLTMEIQQEMKEINDLQDQIRLMNSGQQSNLNIRVIQLARKYRDLNLHCEELKSSYYQMHQLERKFIRQKSPVELVNNCIKFALAGIVLAGTVLVANPINAGIGMGLLASAALVSLLAIIAKKTIQIIQKRLERDSEKKRPRKIEITLTTTSAVFQSLNAAPSAPAAGPIAATIDQKTTDSPTQPTPELTDELKGPDPFNQQTVKFGA